MSQGRTDVRRIVASAIVAFALSAQQPLQAADAGTGGLNHEKGDAGARTSVRPPTAPAGAFLGPLPLATAPHRPGDSDPEQRYPLKPNAGGGLWYEAPQFSAVVAPDGTVTFHDRRLRYSAPKTTFSFDLSDEFVHDFRHGTLHRYEKANFLAATFKRRTEMAAEWYAGQMRAAIRDLPGRLDVLWADARYRRRERRRIIFLLWEGIDDSAADTRPAATAVEAWVRKRLPRNSPDAFTRDELDAWSRERTGAQVFQPYGSPLEMRSP